MASGQWRVTLVQLLAVTIACVASTGCQPKDVRPGLWIAGEATPEHVVDWRFTDDIEEIFIETRSPYLLPHSTTIWCVELGGQLYVGSYGEDKKTWEKNLARRPEARLSIAGKVYDVTLVPVVDPDLGEALDGAYAEKYDMADVFGSELPPWWYYLVEQRGSRSGGE
jgi:hypothetical protein